MPAAALVLVFDTTSVLALMYPGRERVKVAGLDGVTYVCACKSDPVGEAPLAQAEKAQVAFEENSAKFAEAFVGEMMQDLEAGDPAFTTTLVLIRSADSRAGAISSHLKAAYGRALLG